MPRGLMLACMSAEELTAWRVLMNRVEPIGARRADYQAARVAETMANIWRDHKRRREPFTAEDFLLDFGAEPREEESYDSRWQRNLTALKAWAQAMKGRR
jgi:hypothetical protein